MDAFLKAMEQGVLVFDGGMGTMLEMLGARQECNEELCLSRPDIIAKVHTAYLDAGADIITTNTFGASRTVLADHGLADHVGHINRSAAAIARKAADAARGTRFVAGELGPTSKLPTLGHVSFQELEDAYAEQLAELIAGSVDLIIIQTCQDPLQFKAAASACRKSFSDAGKELPVVISATVERSGAMLLGTDIVSAMTTASPYGPAAFGINCATGPEDMEELLVALAAASPFPIICQPNAGMPRNVGGVSVYELSPEVFAERLAGFVDRFGVTIVGGCCGTTPEHIAALSRRLRRSNERSARRIMQRVHAVSSLYSSIALDQEPRPFLVAEQTNVNGSQKFREMLLAENFDAMAEVGRRAAQQGHALDICVAYAGRDEKKDLAELVRKLAIMSEVPLMVDSTNPEAMEAALALIPGRPIVNSINLEDGGMKAKRVLCLARRFGAAVVALTIDEEGMAKTAARKLEIAKRLVDLAREEGLCASDVLIDPLTFTLASGDPELRNAGAQTLAAIADIKRCLPEVRTILGVSNISFGLPPKGRAMVTSAFLNRALAMGLDAAIINPMRIVPMDSIPEEVLGIIERLIDGDASRGDPLAALLSHIEAMGGMRAPAVEKSAPTTPREALARRVASGVRDGLAENLAALMREMAPRDIINAVLLPAMREVGALFGQGKLPLPFVLQSAETMRAAIDLLAEHLKGGEEQSRGTIVLATVRGDVHDIGKNLVDAILSNNGFRVVNLGIKQTASAIIEAVKKESADAIGLSGLLVSSTEVMREDLALFREAGLDIPVLCGGAALTASFVAGALSTAYDREVFYCPDAFSGLKEMERISEALVHEAGTRMRT